MTVLLQIQSFTGAITLGTRGLWYPGYVAVQTGSKFLVPFFAFM